MHSPARSGRHNGAVPGTRSLTLAALTLTGLLAASCSSQEPTTEPTPSPTASPSPTTTVSIPPDVSLTEPGSDLSFGDSATVVFEPNQKTGTVLELTVDGVTQGSLDDFARFALNNDYTRNASYYYVDVTVENVGEGDVGDHGIPLWGVDGTNTLLPAVEFTTDFDKCASAPLPKEFGAGESVDTCLVYLAPDHGSLEAVSFRPDQEFDPIEWTGEITTPEPEPKKKRDKKANRG